MKHASIAERVGRTGRDRVGWLLGAVPVLLAAIVYHGVLERFFRTDDFLHLYEIVNHGFAEFVLRPHGGHVLPLRNAIFYACYQVFGLQAELYQLLALVTHLVNVHLLFRVIDKLTASPLKASFGACLWGISPAHYSMAWYSIYGHHLVAAILLWILLDVARIVRGELAPRRATLIRWYLLWVAASACYGTGLAAALSFGPVVFLLLAGEPRRGRIAWGFASLIVVLPALYLVQYQMYFQVSPAPHTWTGQGARLLLGEWGRVMGMLLDLMSYGLSVMGLGPFVAWTRGGRGLLEGGDAGVLLGPLAGEPITTLLLVARGFAGLFAAWVAYRFVRGDRIERAQLLGFTLLALGIYGMIAVGRSGFANFPGLMARYHYVGPIPLAILVCLLIPRGSKALGAASFAVWVAAMGLAHAQTGIRYAPPHGREEFDRVLVETERKLGRYPAGADAYLLNEPFASRGSMDPHFPGHAAIFIITHPQNTVDGRRVYFVEPDPRVLAVAARRRGSRIADLLVAPAQVPGILGD